MIEFEKLGIPTAHFVAEGFERDARRSHETFGLPGLPMVVARAPFTNRSPEAVCEMVDERIGQVIAALTQDVKSEAPRKEITVVDEEWLTFQGDDLLDALAKMNRRFLEFGWSDGFPLCPPTERQMDLMLSGTSRAPEDVVVILEPGFGIATVEKIAANAVMAGCRPEHLPVLIAAVECLAEPKFAVRNKAISTGPDAPLLIVNGPVRKKIGLNSGVCTLGPGAPSHVNTVIGRALRLCMMNVGHVYPGISDMDTIGSPIKYSMCAAENQEASPWAPYHTEHGYDEGVSTVTVSFVYGMCELKDFASFEPSRLIELYASAAMNVASVPTGLWLIGRRANPDHGTEEQEHDFMMICPEHARIFSKAGWSKDDIKLAMHKKARMPFHTLMLNKEPESMAAAHPELGWLWDSPDTLLPVLEDADCYDIVVVGGTAGRGGFFWGKGGPVMKAIEE